jgi:3-oxoacyl-[acyl-carrier protein] reductase
MIDFGFTGKRAMVVGAGYLPSGAGMGRFTALRLAAAGAAVACVDIDSDRAGRIADEIVSNGGKAFPVVADVLDREQIRRAVDESVRGLGGGVDVLVDIIGQAIWGKVLELSPQAWDDSINANLTQAFYLFQAVGQQMLRQSTGGSIVALTSTDGIAGSAFHAPYGAAKAGLISLAKSFAEELGRYGIRVNTVAPGNVGSGNEDQAKGDYAVNELNPLAAPRSHDIANAVLFLSSDLAARITGQTLTVDGGATTRSAWGFTEHTIADYGTRETWLQGRR